MPATVRKGLASLLTSAAVLDKCLSASVTRVMACCSSSSCVMPRLTRDDYAFNLFVVFKGAPSGLMGHCCDPAACRIVSGFGLMARRL